MNLKKIGKVFTSKFVGTGSSSYEKKNLPGRGLTKVEKHWYNGTMKQVHILVTGNSPQFSHQWDHKLECLEINLIYVN
jgi:hypothetical protein